MTKPANCFLAIDKPQGISSFDVIRQLRRITGIRKIGHTGTLDPFATGLLICCLGSYTRLASLLEAETKSYLATVKLGEQTETGDPEGAVCQTGEIPCDYTDWTELKAAILGLTELPTPAYSAVKVNGERAYALSRKGQKPQLPLRQTRISSFELVKGEGESIISTEGLLSYRCTVSKGTYIRSLSEWLAKRMGTVGYTVSLRREAIGGTSLESAVQLADLKADNWSEYALEARQVLSGYPALQLNETEFDRVKHGIDLPGQTWQSGQKVALYFQEELIAVAQTGGEKLHPYLVLN